jgi:hypothetical protein
MHYLCRNWLADLYRRPDLIPYLRNDLNPLLSPPGSLHRSEGWKTKVQRDPIVSDDPRNAPLTVEMDAAPYFKDKNCGNCNFGTLRHASLPNELRVDGDLAHLFLTVPGQHLGHPLMQRQPGQRGPSKEDPSKPITQVNFSGGSIQMTLLPFVEEMRQGYKQGHPIRDHSLPVENPRADFMLHSSLMLWIGDYPGQGKACNMAHAGNRACHWCCHPFPKILNNTGGCTGINNRRDLPPEHTWRSCDEYGVDKEQASSNQPAQRRTHADTANTQAYITFANIDATTKKNIIHNTGVKGVCVLTYVYKFDIIEDIMIDWMHVIERIIPASFIAMLKGEGKPKVHLLSCTIIAQKIH